MKYKIGWFIILFFSFSMLLFFIYSFVLKLNFYFNLNSAVKANVEKIEILNLKKDKFKIFVEYSFVANSKHIIKKVMLEENYLNYFMTKDFINKSSKKEFMVWFNLKDPRISSIEKIFPLKNCIYGLITLFVFIYFIILKYYLLNLKKNG